MASLSSAGGSGGGSDVHAFITSSTQLVSLERAAEVAEEAGYKGARSARDLERAGVLLSRLVVTDVTTGLYGRCLLTLEPARGGPLPQSEFGVRDIVELAAQGGAGGSGAAAPSGAAGAAGAAGGSKITSGVVYRLKESSMTLVLDEFLEPSQRVGQLSVLKLANQVTYDRYKYGLDMLTREFASGSSGTGVSSRLLRVLYADVEPLSSSRPTQWIPFSSTLNASQKEAVQNALDANDVYMIHGPPGTGKTTTVVELIRQLVARGLRVLACAPSNLAVDNLVEKLGEKLPVRQGKQTYEMAQAAAGMADGSVPASSSAAFTAALASHAAAASSLQSNRGYDIRLCRLGHPARIIPSVLKYTLDSVVKTSDAEAVCAAMRADMAALNKAVDKSRDRNERNGLRRDVRELQRALRDRERRAIGESLRSTEVLCCTLVNAASKLMDQFAGPNGAGFDVVVIDEAAQALEVACLLPIIKGRKLILAGDNQQLGPTVKSKEACAGGLERTLFDRLYAREYERRITTMLVEQYRMNGVIMKWSSDELYQGRLIGPPSITSHLLCHLDGVASTEDTQSPFVVIDTAGLNMYEDEQSAAAAAGGGGKNSLVSVAQQRSKANQSEASLLRAHLEALVAAGVRVRDIGLITPYNGQVSLLREQLLEEYGPAGLEIGTVDGFQGREKEAILISLVRSNDAQEVGFLREDRRINVAITRARRHVCIVLDSGTVSAHPFLARLVDYASEHGDYRMATDPNEVKMDFSSAAGGGKAMAGTGVASGQLDGSAVSAASAEHKEDGSTVPHQSPVVSKPKAKKERARPSLPSSTSAVADPATATAASSGVVQPVPEEWSEARVASLCEDVLRAGRRVDESRGTSDERTRYSFPSTLNSFERHLVHEVAERIGGRELSHAATGEGMQRRIVLQYVWPKQPAAATKTATPAPTAKEPSESAADGDDNADDEDPSSTAAPGGPSSKRSKKQAKKAAQLLAAQQQQQEQADAAAARDAARRKALDAMELKATGKVTTAAAARPATASAPAPVPAAQPSGFAALAAEDDDDGDAGADDSASSSAAAAAPSKAKNKKAKKKGGKSSSDADAAAAVAGGDEEDFDALLADFGHDVCKYSGCSARVKVMGFLCEYCKEMHCVKHMNPTLHGCAAAHKNKQLGAMQSALKAQQRGAGAPLKDADKALLRNKLDKKIAEDKKTRTAQTKKEEKKK